MHTARELSQSTSSFMTQTLPKHNANAAAQQLPRTRRLHVATSARLYSQQFPPKTRGRCYHPEQPAHLTGQACRLTATILAYNSAQQLRGGHTHNYADQTHVRALRQPHARAQDNTAERAQNNKLAILIAHHRCIEGS